MNSRAVLLLVVALFVLPPLAAWLLHIGVFEISGDTSEGKNNGDLIYPVRPLENVRLQDVKGRDVVIDNFLGQWSIVQFADNPCIEDCMRNIYKMRQIRLATGKDAYRIQRVVISKPGTDLSKLLADNPGTESFILTEESNPLLSQFPDYVENDIASISGRIYIVDPLGNLMMQYPDNTEASAVLKDLRQLLRATWIRPVKS